MKLSDAKLILGPPGTGKTTDLMRITSELYAAGVRPDEVAFIAFTRKAATEAKERAMEKFNFIADDLPWFRTIHSLAFGQLGLNRSEVMGYKDYLSLCSMLGLSITFKGIGEDGTIAGLSKGDRMFFTENLGRATMTPLKDLFDSMTDEDLYWYELEQLQKTVLEYKRINCKCDYTDILYRFCDTGLAPSVKAVIVDEAQDLSAIQWKVVEKLLSYEGVEEAYIAGDDDQAIFRWAGAATETFLSLPCDKRVLPRSYRVPTSIQVVAESVASRISNRIPKHWEPREAKGEVNYANQIDEINMDKGSWLLLGRNAYVLERYNEFCIRSGYVFSSTIGSPTSGPSLKAIIAWEQLRKGNSITASDAQSIYDLMTVKIGVTYGFKQKVKALQDQVKLSMADLRRDYGLLTEEIWHKALDKLPAEETTYFISALKRGEKLTKTPRIKVSTIHGVKGGEADHVVIITDMAARTFREYQESPDDEHRVWYVAVTRARETLTIIQPETDRAYEI